MTIDALREPVAAGVKVTLIVQFVPAGTLVPQVFHWLKSSLLAPDIATLLMVSTAVPVFVSVTVCALLLVPTACEAYVKLGGVRLTVPDWRRIGCSPIVIDPPAVIGVGEPLPLRSSYCTYWPAGV